jgi:hypothetical protein
MNHMIRVLHHNLYYNNHDAASTHGIQIPFQISSTPFNQLVLPFKIKLNSFSNLVSLTSLLMLLNKLSGNNAPAIISTQAVRTEKIEMDSTPAPRTSIDIPHCSKTGMSMAYLGKWRIFYGFYGKKIEI